MNFIDQAEIYVKGGDGGRGCSSFRREKYVPRGGPDGGDGGDGGNVVMRVDTGLNTLLGFRHRQRFVAGSGRAGSGNNRHGKCGSDLVVRVPPGTLVKDLETGMEVADLVSPEDGLWIAARGGKGGRGNARFATSTNQAPVHAQKGTPGVERRLLLELKLVADVGLLGMPNAGKSTFLSRVSAARPKIADYPFTTTAPSLGVVSLSDERVFVIADIPGLIEGAHEGVGMGLDFLRHVERCAALLHIVDISCGADEAIRNYRIIMEELRKYHAPLLDRNILVALNKIDLLSMDEIRETTGRFEDVTEHAMPVSAYTGQGIPELLERLYRSVSERQPDKESPEVYSP
jgi:GTP-binding protein